MRVILSNQCLSCTGALERGTGYFLQARRKRNGEVGYYSRRLNGYVPPDGHWRFIVLCAELAQNKLYITDIEVSREELSSALREAHHFVAADHLLLVVYHARDILNLKTTFSL